MDTRVAIRQLEIALAVELSQVRLCAVASSSCAAEGRADCPMVRRSWHHSPALAAASFTAGTRLKAG